MKHIKKYTFNRYFYILFSHNEDMNMTINLKRNYTFDKQVTPKLIMTTKLNTAK